MRVIPTYGAKTEELRVWGVILVNFRISGNKKQKCAGVGSFVEHRSEKIVCVDSYSHG